MNTVSRLNRRESPSNRYSVRTPTYPHPTKAPQNESYEVVLGAFRGLGRFGGSDGDGDGRTTIGCALPVGVYDVQVDCRGGEAGVSEVTLELGDRYATAEFAGRIGVAQFMGRDSALEACPTGQAGYQRSQVAGGHATAGDGLSRTPPACLNDGQEPPRSVAALRQPQGQALYKLRVEVEDAVLSTLAAVDTESGGREVEVSRSEVADLGDSQAGAEHEQDRHLIAQTGEGCGASLSEESGRLLVTEGVGESLWHQSTPSVRDSVFYHGMAHPSSPCSDGNGTLCDWRL